jgi:hypothetical protein
LRHNARELIRLLPPSTPGIGFTGGEPTIYGERLIELLRLCRNLLPEAAVHVLSRSKARSRACKFALLAAAIAYLIAGLAALLGSRISHRPPRADRPRKPKLSRKSSFLL